MPHTADSRAGARTQRRARCRLLWPRRSPSRRWARRRWRWCGASSRRWSSSTSATVAVRGGAVPGAAAAVMSIAPGGPQDDRHNGGDLTRMGGQGGGPGGRRLLSSAGQCGGAVDGRAACVAIPGAGGREHQAASAERRTDAGGHDRGQRCHAAAVSRGREGGHRPVRRCLSSGRAEPARNSSRAPCTGCRAAPSALRRDQLRGDSREPARERTVRLREGRLHRCRPAHPGQARAGRQGNGVPG